MCQFTVHAGLIADPAKPTHQTKPDQPLPSTWLPRCLRTSRLNMLCHVSFSILPSTRWVSFHIATDRAAASPGSLALKSRSGHVVAINKNPNQGLPHHHTGHEQSTYIIRIKIRGRIRLLQPHLRRNCHQQSKVTRRFIVSSPKFLVFLVSPLRLAAWATEQWMLYAVERSQGQTLLIRPSLMIRMGSQGWKLSNKEDQNLRTTNISHNLS